MPKNSKFRAGKMAKIAVFGTLKMTKVDFP